MDLVVMNMMYSGHTKTFMRLYILILVCICAPLVASLAALSRICDPSNTNPQYTGFRIDRQILLDRVNVVKSHQTYLSLCKDGRLVNSLSTDEDEAQGVPWNHTICNGINCYKIARAKSYAMRPISIFAPGKIVGGLFELKGIDLDSSVDMNFAPIERLVADHFYHQWIEINKKKDSKIYHIPLFHTPDETDRKYNSGLGNWFETISANEKYSYSAESRNKFRYSVNVMLDQLKNVIQNSSKKIKVLNSKVSDSKPIRKAIKAINSPKSDIPILNIFKNTIDSITKKRLSKDEVDFNTLAVLSYALPNDQFDQVLKNLNVIYDRLPVVEQKFHYDI